MEKDIKDLKILISNEQLIQRIKELANAINNSYDPSKKLTLVCVLRGAVMFYTELSKYLKMPVEMDFIRVSSYGNSETSSGQLIIESFDVNKYQGKDVLIVEDIIDSGLTLDFVLGEFKKVAKSVKLAVLFDKKCARKYDVPVDFSAFDIDNKFIIGFGLDYCQLYRNLDYIGYFE